VLHHIVRMGTTDEELLEAIRTGGFTGDTVIGQDLDWFYCWLLAAIHDESKVVLSGSSYR
jgi:hypothetical protein